MSVLNQINKNKKVKTYLEGVHFDFEGEEGNDASFPHVAYTAGSGAASLMNEAFLLKSKEGFSKEEADILKNVGLTKPSGDSSSVQGDEAGEELDDNNVTKEKDNTMSEAVIKEMQDEISSLRKALAMKEAKESISGYDFPAEVADGLSALLAEVSDEQKDVVIKAFDAMKAKADEAVEKALENKKVDEEESSLAKKLEEEEGEAKAGEDKELSFVQRVIKAQESK